MLPTKYKPKLGYIQTQHAIKVVKDTFEKKLSKRLHLIRVTAPRFLIIGTGLQDDLAGTQVPVGFNVRFTDKRIEMVHSLAKWKRHMLGKHSFGKGTGIYTDMDAVRKDEDVDETHSIYVDQWDWELVIGKDQRKLKFLREIVKRIYSSVLETENEVWKKFGIKRHLPRKLYFVHSEELESMYPTLTSRQREDKIAAEHGAVFIIGIGYPLKSGEPHDLRAADYDDWSTETENGRGLNGDLIVWDQIRQKSVELSSMGIRVDAKALVHQLDRLGLSARKGLMFHKGIIEDKIPLSIGGGIGQSRLCMVLLQKAHIAEVQSSVWPESVEKEFERKKISLL